MPFFLLFLAYYILSGNYLSPVGSTNFGTDSAVSDDWATDLSAALPDSGDLKLSRMIQGLIGSPKGYLLTKKIFLPIQI